mgnify:CR=1 FL=1
MPTKLQMCPIITPYKEDEDYLVRYPDETYAIARWDGQSWVDGDGEVLYTLPAHYLLLSDIIE